MPRQSLGPREDISPCRISVLSRASAVTEDKEEDEEEEEGGEGLRGGEAQIRAVCGAPTARCSPQLSVSTGQRRRFLGIQSP